MVVSRVRFASMVLGAVAVCSIFAAPGSPAPEGSPLYVAERGDSKVYIFGACGAQSDGWLSNPIRKALSASSELWREIPTVNLDAAAIAYSDRIGSLPQGSLFDILSKEEALRVLGAGQKLGITRARLRRMKVWYAARILTFASYAKSGNPVGQAKDPELLLSEIATSQGKPIKSEYPDWDEFVGFFDRMPESVQKQYLAYSLDDIEHGPRETQAGDRACGRGDPSYFEKSVLEFSLHYPELYKYLNGDRDAEWARKISNMLSAGGIHFLVVGVNHTVGPQSIQSKLEEIGISTQRM